MKLFGLLLFAFATVAHGSDFADRVAQGKQTLASPAGQKYEASWGNTMGAVLVACVPVGSTSPANLGRFTFVADVSPVGAVSAVAVRPSTAVSECFARHFRLARLPPPPIQRPGSSFPVSDDIVVSP